MAAAGKSAGMAEVRPRAACGPRARDGPALSDLLPLASRCAAALAVRQASGVLHEAQGRRCDHSDPAGAARLGGRPRSSLGSHRLPTRARVPLLPCLLAAPFLEPVRWEEWGLHDYPKVIKQPMDLGLVMVRPPFCFCAPAVPQAERLSLGDRVLPPPALAGARASRPRPCRANVVKAGVSCLVAASDGRKPSPCTNAASPRRRTWRPASTTPPSSSKRTWHSSGTTA